ncbi:MAG: SDR family oxidoreductase [Actinomyces sp.]|nr:MAG: SDR family oxidoreductase [Actinomyces sp.]
MSDDELGDLFRLDGRVAIVTGASRGIGAATAVGLAECGADVVIGARDADALDGVAAAVAERGRRAVAVPGDLSTRDALARLVDAALDDLGRLDIVVNNIGGALPRPFLDTSEKAFEAAFHFNVTTAFDLTQLATPPLLATGGGAVVNIASVAGQFAERGFAAYGTAKAALIHLTRILAQDLAPHIRVNAVCPGSIATPALDIVLQTPELAAEMIARTPLGRLGTPRDIAAAVVYLASPAAAYVTGQVLGVDGGIRGSTLDLGIADYDPAGPGSTREDDHP